MSDITNSSKGSSLLYKSFLLLIIWLPFPFGSNRPWAWSILEIAVFSIALMWLVLYLKGKVSFSIPFTKAMPAVIIYLLWLLLLVFQILPLPSSLVSMISPKAIEHAARVGTSDGFVRLSLDPYATLVSLYKSIAYFLFFCISLLILNSRSRLITLSLVIVFSGLFQAMYGSLMVLSGLEYGFFIKKFAYIGNATGTFVNRNHLAAYLVMSLALGIGLMVFKLDRNESTGIKHKIRYFFGLLLSQKLRLRLYLVLIVIGLVLTHSRMGNASFFLGLMLAGIVSLILSKNASRQTVLLLASLIIIDLMIVGTWFGLDNVADRLEKTSIEKESRDNVYVYVLEEVKDYKYTGTGLGTFYGVFPNYRGQDVPGFYDHAHNDYLQFTSETGVIGMALLSMLVLVTLVTAIKANRYRNDPLMQGISFAVIMAVFAMLIHASVDFSMQIPANAATFNVILALAWIARYHPSRLPKVKPHAGENSTHNKNT